MSNGLKTPSLIFMSSPGLTGRSIFKMQGRIEIAPVLTHGPDEIEFSHSRPALEPLLAPDRNSNVVVPFSARRIGHNIGLTAFMRDVRD